MCHSRTIITHYGYAASSLELGKFGTAERTCHGVPEHMRLNGVFRPSRQMFQMFLSFAKTSEFSVLSSFSSTNHSAIYITYPVTVTGTKVHQKEKITTFMMDVTRCRSILFFRNIDKTERTFVMNPPKHKERERESI